MAGTSPAMTTIKSVRAIDCSRGPRLALSWRGEVTKDGVDVMAFRKILPALGAGLMLWASMADVSAQQWPSRPVKVVVPYGVGGVTDTMARLTADRLSKALGQPFVIENK